jgi:hypothetical protein
MSYNHMLETTMVRRKKHHVPTIADLMVERMIEKEDPVAYLQSIKEPVWLRHVAEELLKRI